MITIQLKDRAEFDLLFAHLSEYEPNAPLTERLRNLASLLDDLATLDKSSLTC